MKDIILHITFVLILGGLVFGSGYILGRIDEKNKRDRKDKNPYC